MDISILVGATCAVVRIKIKTYVNNTKTKWQILYKKASSSGNFEYSPELDYESVYGGGPLFYDLTGLEQNTRYAIKMVVTSGYNAGAETSVKYFTTCANGDFDYAETRYMDSASHQAGFNTLLDIFKNSMIAVGYNGKEAKVYCKKSEVGNSGAITYYGSGLIYLKEDNLSFQVLAHEYRHFLGLSLSRKDLFICYHGDDPCGEGFSRGTNWFKNICKVIGFCRGRDEEDSEVYMFFGENSIDSIEIPREESDMYNLLQIFLLKALTGNSITIVY